MSIEKKQFENKKLRAQKAAQLARGILPKKDFADMMTHDKTYLEAIQRELEYKIIKADILSKKAKKVIDNQTRDTIIENIDLLCDFAQLQRECFDLKAQVFSQEKLVEDKQNHYDYVFLPQYEKELKECGEKFEETFAQAQDIRKIENKENYKDILNKLEFEFEVFDNLSKKEKENEEYKLNTYKPLKRIISAFEKKKEEIEDRAKYAIN